LEFTFGWFACPHNGILANKFHHGIGWNGAHLVVHALVASLDDSYAYHVYYILGLELTVCKEAVRYKWPGRCSAMLMRSKGAPIKMKIPPVGKYLI
jgi:hypothetical protein